MLPPEVSSMVLNDFIPSYGSTRPSSVDLGRFYQIFPKYTNSLDSYVENHLLAYHEELEYRDKPPMTIKALKALYGTWDNEDFYMLTGQDPLYVKSNFDTYGRSPNQRLYGTADIEIFAESYKPLTYQIQFRDSLVDGQSTLDNQFNKTKEVFLHDRGHLINHEVFRNGQPDYVIYYRPSEKLADYPEEVVALKVDHLGQTTAYLRPNQAESVQFSPKQITKHVWKVKVSEQSPDLRAVLQGQVMGQRVEF